MNNSPQHPARPSGLLAILDDMRNASEADQARFEKLAKTILDLEPMLEECDGEKLVLKLPSDARGQSGDGHDILLVREGARWKTGLSLKRNHFVVKRGRLGGDCKHDFALEWCGHPCSQEYWNAIAPVFARLTEYKEQGMLWREVEDKDTTVYAPLLEAFCEEVRRCDKALPDFPRRVVSYMMGEWDFYKMISVDAEGSVRILGVNIQGSLNRPADEVKPRARVPRTKLPTRLLEVGIKESRTKVVEMYFDAGWAFSLRIHHAGSKVVPSLEWDVGLLGTPVGLSQMSYCRARSR